jgi:hypothetical protein
MLESLIKLKWEKEIETPIKRHFIISRKIDFWFLGGASLGLWSVLSFFDFFRTKSEAINTHFMQLAGVFAIFSLVCNLPHFIISYKLAYSRGIKFIFSNWFSLMIVPIFFLLFYFLAYHFFNDSIPDLRIIKITNQFILSTGLIFQFGNLPNIGQEILSFTVRIMYFTVGWHYSKQVFGCMMLYSKYDDYQISTNQRLIIKASVFSIAFFNFFYQSIYAPEFYTLTPLKSYFFNIALSPIGFSAYFIPLSLAVIVITFLMTLYFVFYKNYKLLQKKPSINFLISWIAFYIWWIPINHQNEFYFLAVPFFHSLQYFPFAYEMEFGKQIKSKNIEMKKILMIILIVFIGFASFELIPSLLDRSFDTVTHFNTWFFMITFDVFINVHHFFIDSVIWRFDNKIVRSGLL